MLEAEGKATLWVEGKVTLGTENEATLGAKAESASSRSLSYTKLKVVGKKGVSVRVRVTPVRDVRIWNLSEIE